MSRDFDPIHTIAVWGVIAGFFVCAILCCGAVFR